LGWKESKIGRKRRKKVEFDLTLLAGKAKSGGIGLTPARGKSKKKRGDKTIRSHVKKFGSPAVLAHDKKNERHLDLAHPILLMCQNCGLEGLQSEWVKRGESKQSKPKLTCPRCGSSEHSETE
jgi:hypothetical protein